ncbi:Cation/H(+) antiporter like [Quillaja saponaria]|uniref:Cation/H(+) antiporter like n=1 Tax=Quillaja saponaria TaxID=32244 RepID=A0AAD7PEH9_QUISA|nr:Cation/H(+) antiporter like [Quillaja saponaria]
MGSKLGGTLFVCHYLKIPPSEGIFLGFVLNMRGYADLLFIGSASKQIIGFSDRAYNVLLISIVINTIISGIVVGFLRSAKENVFVHDRTTLELLQQEEDELRILACVHEPRHVAPLLAVMAALHGSQTSPISCHLLHLIELVKKSKSNLLYHQKEDHEFSDDEDYGGNDVVQIQEAVDHFTSETQILIHHSKVVSSFANLFEDVCNIAEDLRVSTILLPFHKHQRIDGKMESGKEGIRTTNQKVLRHAPCSVGIVVGRGFAGVPGFSQLIGTGGIQNVATLFFGGPDDREAIAWSIRIAKHHRVNLTIIRFLSASSLQNNQTEDSHEQETEVLMALSSLDQTMNEIDNTFMVDFYNRREVELRYVASGQIGYVEKYVCNGVQTVAALKEIGDLYSLFMVGKGGRGNCPLTISLSDWEECPELGTVGDVLASPEFNITGSVVVIQQHRDVRERP